MTTLSLTWTNSFYSIAFISPIYRKNFIDGWEREGVAIAVFRNDELVVDLQGGYYMQAHSIFGHLTP
ncbi:unnamed protein product [Onchocerca flexuosa]|uniref:MBL fold metallo-hydrolase n=1 Tax=Onchocerca flexuosa TaxID=387005 RepID=A0A183I3V4_9BILA|nr:unnamed protein product [Onchocerca flexuosa]